MANHNAPLREDDLARRGRVLTRRVFTKLLMDPRTLGLHGEATTVACNQPAAGQCHGSLRSRRVETNGRRAPKSAPVRTSAGTGRLMMGGVANRF